MTNIVRRLTGRKEPGRANNYSMNTDVGRLTQPHFRDTSQLPAPIVSASVGSAGMKRTSLLISKMKAFGCSYRLQSALVYDCNSTNVNQWLEATRQAGVHGISVTPDYVPFSDGFQRDPTEFMNHFGAIQRDMEDMLNDMERLMAQGGSRPQIIIEWIGFGGHALISYMLHAMIADRFPSTKVLPIFCLPAERQLEENIRRHDLWGEAERTFGSVPSMVTDNRSGYNFGMLDERVAVALASVEACAQYKPESGTLGETVSIFMQNSSRWLSLDCMEIPHANVRDRKRGRSNRDIKISMDEISHQVLTSIKQISEPDHNETRTASFAPPDRHNEFRLYVVMPFDSDTVAQIQNDVEDLMKREEYERVFPGSKVSFAPGNSLFRGQSDVTHTHISKITGHPVEPMPPSLAKIVRQGSEGGQPSRQLFPTWADKRLRNDATEHGNGQRDAAEQERVLADR